MTEDVQINISGQIDATALNELRKRLNETRNELNAVARETEKTDAKYKQLKATTSELNRLIKMSDTDLKKYSQTLVQTETAVTKVSTAKGKLMTNTDKLSKSFTNLKTNVGSYSTTLVNLSGDIARGDKSILDSVGTLGLYAGGWLAVASAVYLVTNNLIDYVNAQSQAIQKQDQLQLNQMRGSDVLGGSDGSLNKYYGNSGKMFLGDSFMTVDQPTRAGWEEYLKNKPKDSSSGMGKVQQEVVKQVQQAKALDIQGGARLWLKDVPAMDVTNTGGIDLRGIFGGQPQHIETGQEAFARQANQTLDDTQQVYSGISSIMGVLNLGTETFVSKLIGGFSTVLTIMEAIKTVNSILSIIPGFASGGIATGLFMAGERGTELINVGNNTATVYNHADTMRMTNSQNTNPNVSVYLSANISDKYLTAKIENYNSNKRFRRV